MASVLLSVGSAPIDMISPPYTCLYISSLDKDMHISYVLKARTIEFFTRFAFMISPHKEQHALMEITAVTIDNYNKKQNHSD